MKFHGLELVDVQYYGSKNALGFTCRVGRDCSTTTPIFNKAEVHELL